MSDHNQCAEMERENAALRAENARLTVRVGALEAALGKIEWSDQEGILRLCPECQYSSVQDHESSCSLGAALSLPDSAAAEILAVAKAAPLVLVDYQRWASTTVDQRSIDDVLAPLKAKVDALSPAAKAFLAGVT